MVVLATVLEGLGTGLAGPAALRTSLKDVGRSDTGVAGAVTSAASQLGSSIGAALLNTIAASATSGYLATHAAASAATATVHGFTVATVWCVVLLGVAAVPVALFVGRRPAR